MHNQDSTFSTSRTLLKALQNPDLYDFPVNAFRVLETHISWIILTGRYAYKIKKPVSFGFVDFSTLDRRRFYCEEELRLNRRFSSDIYLDVVAIRGKHSTPQLEGNAEIIEYAVKMREFSQHSLLSHFAFEKQLRETHIDSMAQMVADIHRLADKAEAGSRWGSIESIRQWSDENFQQIENTTEPSRLPDYFHELKQWCHDYLQRYGADFRQRQQNGFVRECHGDLHLGNMAFLNNQCTAFDCIEFNPELRWIDTISEVAFVVMDLQARGYQNLSWRFLNRYLSICGDYAALSLLPYYVVYRALVRAKVEALTDAAKTQSDCRQFRLYIELARKWTRAGMPRLILMHGLSGSGKSTVAQDLASRIGAIQIRSDVERKRLFDIISNSQSAVNRGIYTRGASEQTYAHLADIAQQVLTSGFNVIVDAACLKSGQRDLFRQLAGRLQLPFFLISCHASDTELRRRISARLKRGDDASEANLDVLENQLKNRQPLSAEELESGTTIMCDQPKLDSRQIERINRQ